MTKDELKQTVLELCSEDNYGVWELFWQYQGGMGSEKLDTDLFLETISELVEAKVLSVYNKTQEGFKVVLLKTERLKHEIEQIKIGKISDDLYWFGLTDKGNQR